MVNNTIQVKRTDFEVFDALRIDSEDTADVSGSARFDGVIRVAFEDDWKQQHCCLCCFPGTDLSSSPPGPYQQEAYLLRPEDKLKQPPVLPPHLLQVLLNKDTGISVSPPGRLPTSAPNTRSMRINVRFVTSVTRRCSQNRTM